MPALGSISGRVDTNNVIAASKSGLTMYLDAGNRASYRGSGTSIKDLSGNGNNGTYTNGPNFTTVSSVPTFAFNGTNQYISFSYQIPVQTSSTAFTWSGWFYCGRNYDGDILMGLRNNVLTFFKATTNKFEMYPAEVYTPVPLNAWRHITVVYDGTQPNYDNLKVYHNGDTSTDYGGTLTSSTTPVYLRDTDQPTLNSSPLNFYIGGDPVAGEYFNAYCNSVQIYDRALSKDEVIKNFNASCVKFGYSRIFTGIAATGGTITDIAGYRVHTFTSSGTFSITGGAGTIEYLVVGGGGGGGNPDSGGSYIASGGGGAGGVLTGTYSVSSGQSYPVVVGAGGAGGVTGNNGYNGSASSITNITSNALGGGGGGSLSYIYDQKSGESWSPTGPYTGGSGGGGAIETTNGTTSAGAAGTSGQGYAGANSAEGGTFPYSTRGGGGGGGGGAATNGDGGIGYSSSITGSTTYYAGGGGAYRTSGSNDPFTGQGVGGLGGGGNGGTAIGSCTDGTINTGGGGGANKAGGSGIVIIRYAA